MQCPFQVLLGDSAFEQALKEQVLQLGPEDLADQFFLLLGKIGGQSLGNPEIRVGLN